MPKARVTPSSDWREQRRLRAWELHAQGWSQRRIAAELGVTQGAVSQWFQRGREGGRDALRHHPTRGRRSAMTDEQLGGLPALLATDTEAFGFRGKGWTTKRVALALKQLYGVEYHPAHVSRLLRKHCPNWRNRKPD